MWSLYLKNMSLCHGFTFWILSKHLFIWFNWYLFSKCIMSQTTQIHSELSILISARLFWNYSAVELRISSLYYPILEFLNFIWHIRVSSIFIVIIVLKTSVNNWKVMKNFTKSVWRKFSCFYLGSFSQNFSFWRGLCCDHSGVLVFEFELYRKYEILP